MRGMWWGCWDQSIDLSIVRAGRRVSHVVAGVGAVCVERRTGLWPLPGLCGACAHRRIADASLCASFLDFGRAFSIESRTPIHHTTHHTPHTTHHTPQIQLASHGPGALRGLLAGAPDGPYFIYMCKHVGLRSQSHRTADRGPRAPSFFSQTQSTHAHNTNIQCLGGQGEWTRRVVVAGGSSEKEEGEEEYVVMLHILAPPPSPSDGGGADAAAPAVGARLAVLGGASGA